MKLIKAVLIILLVFFVTGCGTSAGSQTSQNSKTSQEQAKTPSDSSSQTALAPTQMSSIICNWIGLDQDIVSPGEIKADGKPDGHFHLAVPFNQPSAIKYIEIRYSEFGKSFKWSWVYNQNLPVQGYVMGLLDGSGKVILPQGDNGYNVEGLMDFELYLSELENENGRDTFKFADHETLDLQINYVTDKNEEKELRYTVRIEGTNGSSQGDQTVTQ